MFISKLLSVLTRGHISVKTIEDVLLKNRYILSNLFKPSNIGICICLNNQVTVGLGFAASFCLNVLVKPVGFGLIKAIVQQLGKYAYLVFCQELDEETLW